MRKSLIGALAVGLTVTLAAVAPAAQAADKYTFGNGKNTIIVWAQLGTGGELTANLAQLKDAAAANPSLKIVLQPFPGGTFAQTVRAAAASGMLPCVMNMDGPNVPAFASTGLLAPIGQYFSKADLADFTAAAKAQGTINGKMYTLPQFDGGLGIWARKSILDKAGVAVPTVANPWTKAQFEDAIAKVSKVAGIKTAFDFVYEYGNGYPIYDILPLQISAANDIMDPKYKKATGYLNSAKSVAFFTWLQQIAKTYSSPDLTGAEFYNGTAAFRITGHWQYSAGKDAWGKDLVLLPMPDLGNGAKTGSGSYTWGITSGCKDKASAVKILKVILSPAESLGMVLANGAVPARKSVAARTPNFATGGDLKVYTDQLALGRGVLRPLTKYFPDIQPIYGSAVLDILKSGADVKTTLDNAAAAIDKITAKG